MSYERNRRYAVVVFMYPEEIKSFWWYHDEIEALLIGDDGKYYKCYYHINIKDKSDGFTINVDADLCGPLSFFSAAEDFDFSDYVFEDDGEELTDLTTEEVKDLYDSWFREDALDFKDLNDLYR
jgi:hypothetical protein